MHAGRSLLYPDPMIERLVLAHENDPVGPWVLPDGTGIDQALVWRAVARLGLELQLASLPWSACLTAMADGTVDGVINVSVTDESLEHCRFTTGEDGAPDPAQRLHTDAYVLYRRRDGGLSWDGTHLSVAEPGVVLVQRGFSVAKALRDHGVQVIESDADASAMLRRVEAGQVAGACLLGMVGEDALVSGRYPGLESLSVPFLVKPYYLVFSHRFMALHGDLAHALWRACADLRSSPEYDLMLSISAER